MAELDAQQVDTANAVERIRDLLRDADAAFAGGATPESRAEHIAELRLAEAELWRRLETHELPRADKRGRRERIIHDDFVVALRRALYAARLYLLVLATFAADESRLDSMAGAFGSAKSNLDRNLRYLHFPLSLGRYTPMGASNDRHDELMAFAAFVPHYNSLAPEYGYERLGLLG